MLGVELVTYRCHLIPMQDTSTNSLIRPLETQQSMRGRLTILVLDDTKTHQVLNNSPKTALGTLLHSSQAPLLTKEGVSVVIAPGKDTKMLDQLRQSSKRLKRCLY